MDGTINADDYALLDRGFAMNRTDWSNGDFNYDGAVTSADYLLADTSYGKINGLLAPGFLAQRQSEFGSGYVAALTAAVPEPSSLFACVFAASFLPAFKRRRRTI